MSIKQDPRVVLFVNGQWTDITYDRTGLGDGVRVDKGIEMFQGEQNESGKPNPAWCKMTFGNNSGDFTPRNPMGLYAGYLNVNTPVAVLLDEITDQFGRTVASSWGDTDTGETYLCIGSAGTAADFNVAGGVATHTVVTANSFRLSWFDAASDAPTIRNVIQKVKFSLPFTDVTGAAIEPCNIMCRVFDNNNYYMVRITIETDETVQIAIRRRGGFGGDAVLAGPIATGITHVAGQQIWVKFGAIDNDLMATAWVGNNEPTGWMITTTDTDSLLEFGSYGIRTGVAAGNTNVPVVVSYDNYSVWLGEFAGEIPDFNSTYTDDNKDALVAIEAAGLMRRLSEGSKITLNAAIRRWYEQFQTNKPDWYWPLDDGELSTIGRATRFPDGQSGSDTVFTFDYTFSDPESSSQKHFAQGKLVPWMPNGVELLPDNAIFLVAMPDGSADIVNQRWCFDWVHKGGAETQVIYNIAGNLAPGVTIGGVPIDIFSIDVDSSTTFGANIIKVTPGLLEAPINYSIPGIFVNVSDGRAHQFRFRVVKSGADLIWSFYIDGLVVQPGATIVGHPFMVDILTFQASNYNANTNAKPTSLGHIGLYLTADPAGDQELTYHAFIGYQGETQSIATIDAETAKTRFARLCLEENVDTFISFTPDPGGTDMGPQYTDALMDQLFEITATDGGMIVEYPDARALNYLTLEELRTVPVGLTINVASGHISPKFKPVDDTQQLRNKIRATKRDGGDYTFQRTDGRLSTTDPRAGGAGVYSGSDVKVNPYLESQLISIAEREVSEGTTDKSRYPQISVNIMASEVSTNLPLRRAILDNRVGSRFKLTGMAAQHIYEDADLLTIGITRFLTNYQHEITWNTIPYRSFDTFHVETVGSILGTDSTYIVDAIDSDDTTTRIITEGNALWTTTAGSWPILSRLVVPPSNVSGEDISVTNVVTTAPAFRSVGTSSHGDNATTTPGLPAGQVAGDTLILVTAIRNTAATAAQPTGYSTIFTAAHFRVCIKTSVGAGETVPNCTYAGGAAGDSTSSFIMAFTNLPFGYVADSVADTSQTNGSAQDIAYPENAYTFNRQNGLELLIAWKQDDYVSIAVPAEYTEIAEYFTTLGNDQGLYAAYRLMPYQDASPAGSLVVTGGAAAISKAYKAYFVNPQVITFARSQNGVVRSWPALTQLRVAYPKVLG